MPGTKDGSAEQSDRSRLDDECLLRLVALAMKLTRARKTPSLQRRTLKLNIEVDVKVIFLPEGSAPRLGIVTSP